MRALRREQVERTPVWFMRQAGRSLPEYRALRERYSFFELGGTPELCAEVTLQPVRRHGVDAAVLFADIMTPVVAMGVDVELVEGVGPVIAEPVATCGRRRAAAGPDPEDFGAGARRGAADPRGARPGAARCVGFCGGPFTVAGYLVEGKPSRDFLRVKQLMYRDPSVWHALMEKLAATFAAYVAAQADAGADVIQLFDSWVGVLSVADYEEFVAPYSARVLAAVDVPTIHFGTGTAHLLAVDGRRGRRRDRPRLARPARRRLARRRRGPRCAGQPRPCRLLGPWERIEAAADDVLERAAGRPGHVFNLGHGVLPQTDPDDLGRLVELVHERTAKAARVSSSAAVVLMAYGSPSGSRTCRPTTRTFAAGGRFGPSCSRN